MTHQTILRVAKATVSCTVMQSGNLEYNLARAGGDPGAFDTADECEIAIHHDALSLTFYQFLAGLVTALVGLL